MGSAAYLADSYSKKQGYGIGIAAICGAAILVDAHPMAALLDSSRKIRRPATVFTACLDMLLAVVLAVVGVLLLMSDDYYRSDDNEGDGPPWHATLGIVVLLTLIHIGRRRRVVHSSGHYECVERTTDDLSLRPLCPHPSPLHEMLYMTPAWTSPRFSGPLIRRQLTGCAEVLAVKVAADQP
ncbi:hypothetical protein NLU13_2543 [Sarocladium strictum]|uniref:Uncharacterized protein n=1 Tax=Sarocladium strictum TaxID=5046 RepID=A0AA39L8Y5_SARSR|nr:hypothetical protein NLU13_2543 [Sarocladium strictum]